MSKDKILYLLERVRNTTLHLLANVPISVQAEALCSCKTSDMFVLRGLETQSADNL